MKNVLRTKINRLLLHVSLLKTPCVFFFQDVSRYTEDSSSVEANGKSISQMANCRQEKIARYKEQKEQERRLKVVENFLSHLIIWKVSL